MGRWVLGVAFVVLSIGLTSPAFASRAAVRDDAGTAAGVDRFVGRYRFVGGQAERDGVLAAIETVVAEVSVLLRGIARSRLQQANVVPEEIQIGHDGRSITITSGGRTYTAPLDGSTTNAIDVFGDPVHYRVSVGDDHVVQTFSSSGGARHNRMRLDEQGRLTVHVVITSRHLPQALRYRLSYRRSS